MTVSQTHSYDCSQTDAASPVLSGCRHRAVEGHTWDLTSGTSATTAELQPSRPLPGAVEPGCAGRKAFSGNRNQRAQSWDTRSCGEQTAKGLFAMIMTIAQVPQHRGGYVTGVSVDISVTCSTPTQWFPLVLICILAKTILVDRGSREPRSILFTKKNSTRCWGKQVLTCK